MNELTLKIRRQKVAIEINFSFLFLMQPARVKWSELTEGKEEDCALLSMLVVVEVVDSTPIDRSTLVGELDFASFERVCGARGCQEYKIFTQPSPITDRN